MHLHGGTCALDLSLAAPGPHGERNATISAITSASTHDQFLLTHGVVNMMKTIVRRHILCCHFSSALVRSRALLLLLRVEKLIRNDDIGKIFEFQAECHANEIRADILLRQRALNILSSGRKTNHFPPCFPQTATVSLAR